MKRYLAIGIGLLLLVVFALDKCSDKKDLSTLQHNLELSRDSVQHFQTRSGQLAAKVEAQEFSISQMKHLDIPELREMRGEIRDLKLQIKNVRSYTQTATVNDKTFIAFRDSTVLDSLRIFRYQDPWLTFEAKENSGGELEVHKTEIDSLVNVVAVERTGFLGLGRVKVNSLVTNKNPDTKIVDVDAVIQESPGLLGRLFRKK